MEILQKYPVHSQDIIWRKIGKEIFLLREDGRQIHALNKTACFAWEIANGKNSISEIISKIVEKFDVAYSEAKEDVFGFFQTLEEKKLVKLMDSSLDGEKQWINKAT